MNRKQRLVVYVTSHGFGHLNRTVAVLNRVAASVPITIRCHRNLFDHWLERLTREAELEHHVSDVGAINPEGNSQETDGKGTLELAGRVHAEAREQILAEVNRLRELNAGVVLCDAPPLPLVAAKRADVPGILLANFTWADIYEPHARLLGQEALALVADYRSAYRQATQVFRAEPALAMSWLPNQIPIGMVVTKGKDRSSELRKALGFSSKERLVYFYIGRYGQSNLRWERIESLGKKGIHFIGFHPPPQGSIANMHVMNANDWTGTDLASSCEAVVAKAGYGTVCEAMAARKPMVYPPRSGFAEHRALDRALRAWGGGVPLAAKRFAELDLEKAIERAAFNQARSTSFQRGRRPGRSQDYRSYACEEMRHGRALEFEHASPPVPWDLGSGACGRSLDSRSNPFEPRGQGA